MGICQANIIILHYNWHYKTTITHQQLSHIAILISPTCPCAPLPSSSSSWPYGRAQPDVTALWLQSTAFEKWDRAELIFQTLRAHGSTTIAPIIAIKGLLTPSPTPNLTPNQPVNNMNLVSHFLLSLSLPPVWQLFYLHYSLTLIPSAWVNNSNHHNTSIVKQQTKVFASPVSVYSLSMSIDWTNRDGTVSDSPHLLSIDDFIVGYECTMPHMHSTTWPSQPPCWTQHCSATH